MTPKEIAQHFVQYHRWTDDLGVESDQYILAQSYLALESRIQKLETVVTIARDVTEIMKCDIGSLTGMHIDGGCDKCRLIEALAELDQP